MPLDGIGAKFLGQELAYRLTGARLDRIYQPDRFSLLLVFRRDRKQVKLYLSANPSSPRIYITSRDFANPRQAPNFCMLLRKYLLASRLTALKQEGYERVFSLKFETINDLGDTDYKYIQAEIMGRYSNIIFLNKDRVIHDALIHVDQDVSSKREIMPARPYQLPPSQDKRSVEDFLASGDEVLDFLENGQAKGVLEKAITGNVLGFSPLLARSIVEAAGLDARLHPDQLNLSEKQQLTSAFYKTAEMLVAGADQPCLYFQSAKAVRPYDFHAFSFRSLPFRREVDSLSLAMDVFYSLQDEDQVFKQRRQEIARRLHKAQGHALKKLDLHQKDYAEGQKADLYQKQGELLNSQLYLVKEGAESVELVDYYDPEQKTLKLKLKAHLTPADNAGLYFKRYRKAKSKLNSSRKLLTEDQAELTWLESLQTALDRAENLVDLEAVEYEFKAFDQSRIRPKSVEIGENPKHLLKTALNPGKPGKKSKKYQVRQAAQKKRGRVHAKTKIDEAAPPRKFDLGQGIVVYAGRNNLQNDRLTLKEARPDDLWFHAKDISGSHVILQAEDPFLLEASHIEQAASIAAWYSAGNNMPAGHGGKLAVDCCQAKYVRKPKGARPGMVIYDHHKTYWVPPALPGH